MDDLKVDKYLLIISQVAVVVGTVALSGNNKNLFLYFYLIACCLCLFNVKYQLYIFYSSIWISIKLYFDVGGIVIRASDITFIFILLSLSINSFYKKSFKVELPKWTDYWIMGFLLLSIYSFVTSLNRYGTIIEIIQIFQLIFLYYILLSLIKDDQDVKAFMIITIIFGFVDSFWVFNSIIETGLGRRYIGLLQKTPDEIPYSLLFLYLFYLSGKNIFSKIIKLFILMMLLVALFFTMGRGLLIITGVMFFLSTIIYLGSKRQYLTLIISFLSVILISSFLISSNQSASKRYGSIVKGGEHIDLRLYNYYSSFMIMKKHPFTGVGLGNDFEYLKKNLPEFSPEIVKKYGGDSPHNELFHFGIQVGLIGMVFAIFFYLSLLYKSFNSLYNYSNRHDITSIAIFASSVGISLWGLANDIILAGNGSFVILLLVFSEMKIKQNKFSKQF